MERRQEILRHIGKKTRGIEIAPWFNPIVTPGGTRKVVVLDVLDRPALLERAKNDPLIDKTNLGRISEVDLVGSACEIAELTTERFGPDARFDFVVSSHNLEHLPDPVRFLRGCQSLLVPGGIVAMTVPDKRACFDFFRPLSTTGEMLQAFHERRERPTFGQTFGQAAYSAALRARGGDSGAFTIHEDANQINLRGDLTQAYAQWLRRSEANDTEYHDTHCWTFTPSSLRLILTELTMLGLLDFEIVSVTRTLGCVITVHLRKRSEDAPAQVGLAERRELLLQQINDELSYTSRYARDLRAGKGARSRAAWGDTPLGGDRVGLLLRRVRGRIRRQFGI